MPGRHRGGQRRRQQANAADREAVAAVFGKTKLCRYHILGTCMKGTACGFAHSPEEMQALPDLSCTKLCPALINTGACNTPGCRYAHNKEELRSSAQVTFGHGAVLLPTDVMSALNRPASPLPADAARTDQERAQRVHQGSLSPSCFFEVSDSGQLRRAMKSFGSNLLIQEEANASDVDDEKPPAGCVAESRAEAQDGNRAPLGKLKVKNTFLDIANPDEPVKLGLRAVKTAGGRLDGLAPSDSDDEVDDSDDEKPIARTAEPKAEPKAEPQDSNRAPLGELKVKNTFLDIATPDESAPLGLREVKTAGGRLDGLAPSDSDDDASDDEKPLDRAAKPQAEPQDSSCKPLGELKVKNTFIDIADPDEPVKLGLRVVKTAGGRLDGLVRSDSQDDEDAWAH